MVCFWSFNPFILILLICFQATVLHRTRKNAPRRRVISCSVPLPSWLCPTTPVKHEKAPSWACFCVRRLLPGVGKYFVVLDFNYGDVFFQICHCGYCRPARSLANDRSVWRAGWTADNKNFGGSAGELFRTVHLMFSFQVHDPSELSSILESACEILSCPI